MHATLFSATARASRRTLLRLGLGAAGLTALAACGGTASPTAAPAAKPSEAASAASKPAEAPKPAEAAKPVAEPTKPAAAPAASGAPATAVPATGGAQAAPAASADGKIPSPVGVPDAYLKAPAAFKSYDGKPGKGAKVTNFTIAYQPPPTPRDQNQYWQELEKRLGVTWEPIITPQPNYGEKSAALLAGGDLPELFYLNPGQNAAPQFKAMEQGAFLDLTPFVTGDAIKEYKNLATIPAYAWNNVKFRGKIYGVPKPLQRNGNIGYYRADWAKKLGKEPGKSLQSVRDMLVAFAKSDPDGNGQADTWGMGRYGTDWVGWDNTLVFNILGLPFNWRKNADGTMTHQIETDEYRQGIDFLRQLNADGALHRDAAGMNFAQAQAAFIGGKTGLHSEGIGNFYSPTIAGTVYFKIKQAFAGAELAGIMPSAISDKAITRNTPGSFGFTGIPAAVGKDKERVKELLRVLDYLCSPFGSEEWLFLQYGLEGVHHTINASGARVVNDKGIAEKGDLIYTMGGLPVFYYPLAPEVAPQAQKLAAEIIKIGLDDPTWPLYSPTNVSKAAEMNAFGLDRATAIVTGREPLTALDQAIKDWKSRGGDQIRKEFEQALKEG